MEQLALHCSSLLEALLDDHASSSSASSACTTCICFERYQPHKHNRHCLLCPLLSPSTSSTCSSTVIWTHPSCCCGCSARIIGVLEQMTQAGSPAGTFLAAVQLIARGCQRAYELAELPGLLPSLSKVRLQEAVGMRMSLQSCLGCFQASARYPSLGTRKERGQSSQLDTASLMQLGMGGCSGVAHSVHTM